VLLIRCMKPAYDGTERKKQHKTNQESRSLRKTTQRKTKEEMDGRGAKRSQTAQTQC